MGMHRHAKHRLASPRQESPMGSVLCAAADFCWSNCPASCRFLGGSVCLGDMAALEDERLKEQSQPNGESRQTALMWQQQPDYARYKEKSSGEGWLVNRQDMSAIDGEEELASQIL